jgi:HK97 family phage portal protein
MGVLSFFGIGKKASTESAKADSVHASSAQFYSLQDPGLASFMSGGRESASGRIITTEAALRNPAVFRSVSLVTQTMGMLPMHMIEKETKKKAVDHPLYRVLHRKPNDWQTAYDFRMLMQLRALVDGNAYALVVRSPIRPFSVLRLIPIPKGQMKLVVSDDWTVRYEYQSGKGGVKYYKSEEVLHLRGLSLDGLSGLSLVDQAADAIGLAISADLAASRMFKQGSFVPGTLNTDKRLSDAVIKRLRDTWAERYSGADNAGATPILEEGLEYKVIPQTARDMQHNELRARIVEEIARVFGIPRPLLMVDETSWGSGIESLGQFFVRYGLNPWFEAWQQAIERTLLTPAEAEKYDVKFNAGALTRGSLKDQAEYFSKASGAGGHQPWLTPNEIRDIIDMPAIEGGDTLENPMTSQPSRPQDVNQEPKDG